MFDSNIIPLPIEFEPVIEKRLIYYLTKLFPTLDPNASIRAEADYMLALNNLKSKLSLTSFLEKGVYKDPYSGELRSAGKEKEQKKMYNFNSNMSVLNNMNTEKKREFLNAVNEAKQNYLNLLDELKRKYL